ncbi:J domain-containing protein [Helicobacter didelphidarum]|uniref:J domain-containing protein n=1 Tax=Helicobacter didelphidarum TaxID=2040648 RepID=A0A3D8IRR1_9HELI|nr:J domain-containing protein [Helicobacter didelphidarum]RDU67670.1 J domain-containing protein [Helicobacter didelphidarum]
MISYCDKYVQIKLIQDSKILNKVLAYADKHFSRHYRLSSSVLILDDGEIVKKNYLINWCYHAINNTESSEQISIEEILAHSHLPIRIKIIKSTDMLEKIRIKIQMLGTSRIILTLSKRNRVAERYIKAMFGEHYIGISQNEIYLQSHNEYFWEKVVHFLGNKIIHNIVLSFEYSDFNADDFSFLTAEERNLRQCYATLDSQFGDDFELVKKRYLKLAKEYHPDNFYGESESEILNYTTRFHQITEAYKKIKRAGSLKHS